MPCYNPIINWELNILNCYKEIQALLPNIAIEVILVNDGSTKNVSSSHIDFLKLNIADFVYIDYLENKGKGFAVRKGVEFSKNDAIIFTDIDFPYTSKSLSKIAEILLAQKADVVIGTRAKNYYKQVPFYRKLISKTLITVNKIFLNLPNGETQAGLKGFSSNGKKAILKSKIDGYLFDIEVLKIVVKENYIIKTSPLELKKDIVFSKMSYKLLWQELKNYIKIYFI